MGLTCYRSVIFSDMPLGMHETFLRLRSDHAMIREVGGLVVIHHDAMWGYSGGEVYGQGLIEDGLHGVQAVVDRLTSRTTRLEHPEYQLDDNTHCLLVTTSESDAHSIAELVSVMEKTMPEHTRCDWLHIERSDGMMFSDAEALIQGWNGGEFDRNCIRNRTASEKVEYGDHEWSAAIIQYLESRMLEREGAVSFDEEVRNPRSFGFATLDFSQTEGKRFLEAKTFVDLVERENRRVDLDLVFRRCSEALKGGDRLFVEAMSYADIPTDLNKLVSIDEDYDKFDVRSRLSSFRDRIINDTGTIEKVEQTVEEGIDRLKSQLDGVLKSADGTAQERLCIVQSMLGQVPDQTHGKPLRTTMMLDDCERDCLNELAALSEHVEEAPSVHELHIQRRFCAEQMDNIVSLTRAIEIDEEAGIDTAAERQELLRQRQDYEKCIDGYEKLRQRYTRFRRGMFAALSSQWMEEVFERLVAEATYEYVRPEVEEKPLLSIWERKLLLATCLILPAWLWIAWKVDLQFWFEQFLLSLIYAAVWGVIISLRLRKPKRVQENPMVEQRRRWLEAAGKYHGAMVRFAALTRFQKLFDEEIRKPLIIEYNRLTSVLNCLREQSDDAQQVIDSSFMEVDFVQHLGDADSFNKYYEFELSASMVSVPSIVTVYLDFMSSKRFNWTEAEAVEEYRLVVREAVEDHLGQLEQFEMLDYLLEREHKDPPLFVDPDLPPLEELMRRATISLGALHDCGKEEDGRLTIFLGRAHNTMMTDRFREQIVKLFPESRQARLDFVMTDDVNRIGFLRMVDIDVASMQVREKQDARRVRRRKPTSDDRKSRKDNSRVPSPPPPEPTPKPVVEVPDPPVPVTEGDKGESRHVSPSSHQITFDCRSASLTIDLPVLTEEEKRAVYELEHFEDGMVLRPEQDVETELYRNHLRHDVHDDQIAQVVRQAESHASSMGISAVEVLTCMVQAIPYKIGGACHYPIETLMDLEGDCDEKSLLLKKLLDMHGVDSCMLLFSSIRHMCLGIRVDEGAEGFCFGNYAFVESVGPSAIGGVPIDLVGGSNPKDHDAELLLSEESHKPWMGYEQYRKDWADGFPSKMLPTEKPIRTISPHSSSKEGISILRNRWKEQP